MELLMTVIAVGIVATIILCALFDTGLQTQQAQTDREEIDAGLDALEQRHYSLRQEFEAIKREHGIN